MVRFGCTKLVWIKQGKNTINIMSVFIKHSIPLLQILHPRRLQMLQLIYKQRTIRVIRTPLKKLWSGSSLAVSLTYLRGLEVSELEESDMPMV